MSDASQHLFHMLTPSGPLAAILATGQHII